MGTIATFMALGFSFGFPFGAVAITSIWTALETTRWRIFISIMLSVAITALFATFVLRTGGPVAVVLVSFATVFLLNIVLQGPLWYLRLRSGYRFTDSTSDGSPDQIHAQFSIANMLFLTTLLAVLIAICKALTSWFPGLDGNINDEWLKWTLMFGFFAAGATTTSLGALWIMSASRKIIPLATVGTIWVGAILISTLQIQTMTVLFVQALSFSIICNLVSVAMVWVPLWFLNRAGRKLAVTSHG